MLVTTEAGCRGLDSSAPVCLANNKIRQLSKKQEQTDMKFHSVTMWQRRAGLSWPD